MAGRSSTNRRRRSRRFLGVIALLVGAAAGLRWFTVDRLIAARSAGATVDEVTALAAAGVLWVCLVWIVVAVTAAVGARLPGALGRICDRISAVAVPRALRGVVVAGLGMTVLGGPTAANAMASATPTTSTSGAWQPAGPVAAPLAAGAGAARQFVATADLPPLDRPASTSETVTVEPGDCLWTIVARRLGPDATVADIAAEWPRWYAANQALIGNDPDLIHPGQRLVLPTQIAPA